MTATTLIVGGGVIGMLTARELALAGNPVTLVDQGRLGCESSWAGGGILSPLYPWRYTDSVTRLAGWSQRHYPALCRQLAADTGIDPELEPSGLLIVPRDDELPAAMDWAAGHGIGMELVDAGAVGQLEPAWAHPAPASLWLPEVGQVRNPRFAKALAADIQRRGVTIHSHCRAVGFLTAADSVRAVRTDAGELQADRIIVCAGAWSGQLLADLLPAPRIGPVRGQMLLFRAEPGRIRRMVLEADRYVIPRRDGRVLFGSTVEQTGFDKSTTATAREELWQIATERFPLLARYPVEHHWAGLRPSSPQGIPYIGRHPQLRNLWLNAGHFRNGVVLGPASARLLADLLLEREPILPAAPYGLEAQRLQA